MAYEPKTYNELSKADQVRIRSEITQEIYTELFLNGRLSFSGEPMDLEDFEKRFNTAWEQFVGQPLTPDIQNWIRTNSTISRLVAEEAERRVWRGHYLVVDNPRLRILQREAESVQA